MNPTMKLRHTPLSIAAGPVWLDGLLAHAPDARGLVVIAQNAAGHHQDSREAHFATRIEAAGFATLIFDLLTRYEETRDPDTRYNAPLLGQRLNALFEWIRHQPPLEGLSVGLVTGGNGCAAAIRAMSREPEFIAALVCRGGRPGLAGADPLRLVQSPACMIVGERDEGIAGVRQAYELLGGPKAWREIPGTDGLFREPGTLDEAASHAADWFLRHLPPPAGQAPAMTA